MAKAGLKGTIPLYTASPSTSFAPLQKNSPSGVPARGVGERLTERRQQEVRRRLHQEVSGLKPSFYGASPMMPPT